MTTTGRATGSDDAVRIPLPADLTAAREARAETRMVLSRWRLLELLDPVLLTVSELVGNAVRHGRPPVEMLLRRTSRAVRVEVHDEAAVVLPDASLPGSAAESGRGLFLVDAVSDQTGVVDIPGDGKVTWASFDRED